MRMLRLFGPTEIAKPFSKRCKHGLSFASSLGERKQGRDPPHRARAAAPLQQAATRLPPHQQGNELPPPHSFNHLVGALPELQRHVEAERLGGLEVDHQLELDWGLDGKLARLRALEDAIGIRRRAPKIIESGQLRRTAGRQVQRRNGTDRRQGDGSEQPVL